MKNFANREKHMDDIRAKLFEALQTEDSEQQKEAFLNFTDAMQNSIMEDAKAEMDRLGTAYNDEQVLINRGTLKPLTSEEKKYFNAVIERKGFDNVEGAFPTTIIEDVFKNLKQEHPLLSRIDMKDTTALATYIFAKPNKATAFWGPICEDIRQMILDGFEEVDVKSSRLSGFVAVCKGMLELGPNWLALYTISIIQEIMASAIELAIVTGTGKNEPIGMMKKLSGATDSVYPDKTKVTMNDFKPTTMAGFRAALAKAKLDSAGVSIMVNPVTYWAKIFPNLAFQTQDGTWVHNVLATGEEIIRSYAVPEDTLIWGDPKNYFLGVSGDVRIDRYDQTLAIEDMELFITKFYGYGLAKDANAFFVADIASITGAIIPTLEEFAENTGDNKDAIITKDTRKKA